MDEMGVEIFVSCTGWLGWSDMTEIDYSLIHYCQIIIFEFKVVKAMDTKSL